MTTSDHPLLDFIYQRRQSPFLAATRGLFGFLHTTGPDRSGMALRGLSTLHLGAIEVPSGKLLAGDPFQGLQDRHNPWYPVPAGRYGVLLTRATIGSTGDQGVRRTAYASVVLDPEKLARRQRRQAKAVQEGRDPQLPRNLLTLVHARDYEGGRLGTGHPYDQGAPVLTGCLALCDAESFEEAMPLNLPGQGWLETLFDHGVPGSWFDRLDDDSDWPKGISYHALPDHDHHIAIFPTGWGDGRYGLWLEVDEAGAAIALHFDFLVIPYDPLGAT